MEGSYLITGVDKDGKRITPIRVTAPYHHGYDVSKGSIWELGSRGKRTLIRRFMT